MVTEVCSRTLERVRREAVRNGYQREPLPVFESVNLNHGAPLKRRTREPEMVGDVLTSYYANRTIAKKLLLPQIAEVWEQIVGPVVAEHTTPKLLIDEVLHVSANSTVWAAQLSALGQLLVNKVNAITGTTAVNRIQINGPKANVPNYGPRTVKGRIGYRDTFG